MGEETNVQNVILGAARLIIFLSNHLWNNALRMVIKKWRLHLFLANSKITAVYPHHSGNIELEFYRDKVELKGKISIPKGMEAVLKWNGKRIKLITGEQDIKI